MTGVANARPRLMPPAASGASMPNRPSLASCRARSRNGSPAQAATACRAVSTKAAIPSRSSGVAVMSAPISTSPWQLKDSVADDAELDLGRSGVDRLGASREIEALEARACRLHLGGRARWRLLQQFEREGGEPLMRLAPVQLHQATAVADAVSGHQPLHHRFDMRLDDLDIDDGLGQAAMIGAAVDQAGKRGVGPAGADQVVQFVFEAPSAIHAIRGALDRQHPNRR